jgi:hypothetical protein
MSDNTLYNFYYSYINYLSFFRVIRIEGKSLNNKSIFEEEYIDFINFHELV